MKIFSLLVFMFVVTHVCAGPFDHTQFDSLLQKHVKNGLVDYKALKQQPELLGTYLDQLQQPRSEEFESWSADEQKVFWINAYNAITIEGILRNYPIQWGGLLARARFPKNSIRQISKFWDTPFVKLLGKDVTLNQIEHDILRKQFNDPRIHFVIVCASIGCPVLENRVFFADGADQRLNGASRDFVLNPDKVRLDKQKNKLYLSTIFKWYKEDFELPDSPFPVVNSYDKKYRGLLDFVLKYLSQKDVDYIIENKPKIEFTDYDWSLNEQ